MLATYAAEATWPLTPLAIPNDMPIDISIGITPDVAPDITDIAPDIATRLVGRGTAQTRLCANPFAAFTVISALALVGASCTSTPVLSADAPCEQMVVQVDDQIWAVSHDDADLLSKGFAVAANPALSPDRSQVAFTAGSSDTDLDLYVVNLDGTDPRLVWAGDASQSSVDWSPDGSGLVFDQAAADGSLQIYRIGLDGSPPVQLTTGAPNGKPNWAPDGGIVFLSLRDGEAQEIYSMDSEGAFPTNLSRDPSARDVLARVSPDATRIAYASDSTGNWDIWIMNRDGAGAKQVTIHEERDTNPTWSPDGSHLVFRSDRDPAGLWAVSLAGADAYPILKHGWVADCAD